MKRYKGAESNAVDGVLLEVRRGEYDSVVLANPFFNLLVIGAMSVIFLVAGTTLSIWRERNR